MKVCAARREGSERYRTAPPFCCRAAAALRPPPSPLGPTSTILPFHGRRVLNAPRTGRVDLGRSDNVYVRKRVLMQVLQGTTDANIRFEDLRSLLGALGFAERIRGDHHILSKPGVAEILNLQPRGSLTKPYQVRQVRSV